MIDAELTCSAIEDIDYAYTFRAVVRKRDFYVLVERVDDGVRQWLVSTNSGLNRLLRERDHDEHRVLTGVLHEILLGTTGIDNVRWYTLTDWNEDPDGNWAGAPGGERRPGAVHSGRLGVLALVA